jgi:hypothetical protein
MKNSLDMALFMNLNNNNNKATNAKRIQKRRKNPLDTMTDEEIYSRYRFDRAGIEIRKFLNIHKL